MPRTTTSTTAFDRVFSDPGWQDSAPLRWLAQLLVGGFPGILVCLVIRWMAGSPTEQGSAAHIASVVPILSASGLVDSAAFHRLKFEPSIAAGHAPQFREPDISSVRTGNGMGPEAPAAPSTVDFNAPRTAWKHLTPAVRAQIDATLAIRRDWQGIVLHGSRVNHGNARLMDRYDSTVRGLSQGLAHHFVIGNGMGAADGLIETGSRWIKAQPAGDTGEAGISVCLIGDFNEKAPSQAQLEAVDELADYLSIKLGRMELAAHSGSSCLGAKFPAGGLSQAK